ncbi:DUF4373 domain-containing protein [Sulfurimonas sp. RIFOXYB12_FULL_35_9]|jgi:hypothetical protein|uniref:DUF4373 domain-containing protein n=1 Tax=Sulfurimonas sp. RIFOXYB12_FULL_35_9 TaxID=1802256 RepID=UPI0008B01623|nr:DUF4373 domain-containing protein [Sulfurimonas sp. RIFOXYB12_FULL_35_9]OHE05411.1 MAG: hypothetical protein A2345_01395 [Sulfurimonas sp. RIFOXYB12_FULL_35_9]
MSATLQKDTCYFSHDANAKDDYKCMLLIDQMGLEGYGIFWVLVETLREQKDYKYPLQLVPSLARKYNTTQAKMETVINAYGLFDIDTQSFFFSGSLNRRMSFFEQKKQQQIEAGKRGVAAKKAKQEQLFLGLSDYDSTNRPLTDPQAIKEKESKEKESKLNINPRGQGSFLKPKVKLNLSDAAAEFKQKLLKTKYAGHLAPVLVEGEREDVYIDEQGLLYTKNRSTKQIVSSTLNEIWEQLQELHTAKYGAQAVNPIQNLKIKKIGA